MRGGAMGLHPDSESRCFHASVSRSVIIRGALVKDGLPWMLLLYAERCGCVSGPLRPPLLRRDEDA